jgi:single-stranded-DNA-specific exonuclease
MGRELPFFVFACDSSYSPGVIGLAASRLSEELYRPVAVVAVDLQDGLAKGSARSIPEFHLTHALDDCEDLLIRHGGHAAAAGFTVHLEDLPALQARLESLARAELALRVLEPSLQADVVVSLHKLPELASWLKRLEPCGQGNPHPVFVAPRVRVVSKRAVGSDGSHLSLRLEEGNTTIDAIAFGRGSDAIQLPEVVAVAFRLEEDDFSGVNRLRLNVLDLGEPGPA